MRVLVRQATSTCFLHQVQASKALSFKVAPAFALVFRKHNKASICVDTFTRIDTAPVLSRALHAKLASVPVNTHVNRIYDYASRV